MTLPTYMLPREVQNLDFWMSEILFSAFVWIAYNLLYYLHK